MRPIDTQLVPCVCLSVCMSVCLSVCLVCWAHRWALQNGEPIEMSIGTNWCGSKEPPTRRGSHWRHLQWLIKLNDPQTVPAAMRPYAKLLWHLSNLLRNITQYVACSMLASTSWKSIHVRVNHNRLIHSRQLTIGPRQMFTKCTDPHVEFSVIIHFVVIVKRTHVCYYKRGNRCWCFRLSWLMSAFECTLK